MPSLPFHAAQAEETAMRRIVEPSHRYGEPDFDRKYLEWGLHGPATQIEEAKSVLEIVRAGRPLRILDLACGVGTHAIHWAKQGHCVTAVDLSEVFVSRGREAAARDGVTVDFLVGDIRTLPYRGQFDLVTWIENSFFDEKIAVAIGRYVAPGEMFVMDVRNPENAKCKQRTSNWRTWREKDGVFYLERHETDAATGLRENVWIEIDPAKEVILEKRETLRPVTLQEQMALLRQAGFAEVRLHTMEGELFAGGEGPYWLWMVGRTVGTA
jgi:SAM-dependent methyltransferase